MKLIGVLDNQEGYKETYNNLLKRFGVDNLRKVSRDGFEKISSHRGYNNVTHFGELKAGVDLTPLELAMVLDNGYGWFGGSIVLNNDRTFTCEIFTD